ncbi:MAG: esterase [SAR86 cluster bacterium]|uniref:Esterase n=1 Tax=SAR86 cluster bacterium TaxID=2030880 RepID=A0A2A5ASW2_9GAMM|nr:MAG: esterase [SAR86 cluster bacterium]
MNILKISLVVSVLTALASCQVEESQVAEDQVEQSTAPIAESDNQIVIGVIDTINSAILDEDRDLWIYVPKSASEPENSNIKYPVMYLLDGNAHFHSVSGMIRRLSSASSRKVAPEMIIVGIPNTDRMRDLTPTHVEGTTGGGREFLDFVENEVIPYVEGNYPASTYRTFVGHSLGGLTVIDALINRSDVFSNYVAIDPSLWWDDQFLLRKAEAALTEVNFSGKSLFVAVANTMRGDMNINNVVEDTSDATRHIRSILQFSKSADAEKGNDLNFGWEYYDNDSHGSVPLIAEYDAFRFLFPWHELKGFNDYFTPESTATVTEVIDHVLAHYQNISSHFEYLVVPPEQYVDMLADAFLRSEKPDIAFAMFSMNLQNYSDSAGAHDAMGDFYVAQEDIIKAAEHFTNAIDLGGTDSKEKLEELQEQN